MNFMRHNEPKPSLEQLQRTANYLSSKIPGMPEVLVSIGDFDGITKVSTGPLLRIIWSKHLFDRPDWDLRDIHYQTARCIQKLWKTYSGSDKYEGEDVWYLMIGYD